MKLFLIIPLCIGPLIAQSQSELKVGDKVEGQWKHGATWYKGTIGEKKDSLYFINYDDGDTEWTTANYIRLIGEKKVAWPDNTCSNKASLYKVGDQVDVEENGIWYDATVLKVNGGQYYIHYDLYSDSYDCVVNNDRIRKWTGKKATSNSSNNSESSGSSDIKESSEITLTNVCRHDVTMYVGAKEYRIPMSRTVDVQITETLQIHAVKNGRKIIVGTAYVNGSIWNFNSRCD